MKADAKKKNAVEHSNPPANRYFLIGLVLLCLLVFGNGLKNKYSLDDDFYTNGNALSKDGFKSIPKIFTDFTFKSPAGDSFQYRPVTMLSFALEAQLFGQKPFVSHFISLLLYTGIVLLLFSLLKKMLPGYNLWFIAAVCALFAAHPMHTEVVDNIKCRDELLAFFFTLLSIHCLIRYFQEQKLLYFFLTYVCLLCAFFSKTSVYPFMASIPLILYFFFDVKGKKILLSIVPFLLVFVTFYLIKQTVLHGHHRVLLVSENPLIAHADFATKSATSFYVLGKYLQLLVFPNPLLYYYGFKHIDLAQWSNWFSILSLLIHVALGLFAVYQFKKKTILSFCILFYLIHMSMYSNLFVLAPGVMGERFAFIASFGFCLALVYLVFTWTHTSLTDTRFPAGYALLILSVVLAAYSIRSRVRNSDWKNRETLFAHDMEDLENSLKANMIYGELLHQKALESRDNGERISLERKALGHFSKATQIVPDYEKAWSNLGVSYYALAQFDKAVACFEKSTAINPDNKESRMNLAAAYEKNRQTGKAEAEYRSMLQKDSVSLITYKKISELYFNSNQEAEGVKYLKEASRQNPSSDLPYIELGRHYIAVHDTAEALKSFELALKKNPDNPRLTRNLASFYLKMGDKEKAKYYANFPNN